MLPLKAAPRLSTYMEPRDLSDHAEYRAGRGVEAVAAELDRAPEEFIALSSNENPLGPSPKAVAAIREAAPRSHRYPKASHTELTAKLADRWDVAEAQVWVANGGDGALDYLARAMLSPGDNVLVPDPGFAYYAMSARFHHGGVRTYPLTKANDFELTATNLLDVYSGERIVYLTSPHNPTGRCISPTVVEEIAAGTDDALVVVDEAYGEYATEPSARTLLDRDDVAILRSFSKAYGLAGVRLGYALVPEPWADAYARVNTPFAASEIACRAGLAALADEEHVTRSIETARSARRYILDNLAGRTWPSEGNFVLAEVGDASGVTARLRERGIVIRDCTSFGLPECVRITCGTTQETRRTVEELNGVLE